MKDKDIIINNDSSEESYSLQELANGFAEIYSQLEPNESLHAFRLYGLKYGKAILNSSHKHLEIIDKIKELCPYIKDSKYESINTELSKGIRLYQSIQSKKFGMYFSDDVEQMSEETTEITKPKETNLNIDEDLQASPYVKMLAAIKSKPFLLLAGISGTGKSRIVRKLAQATVTYELQKQRDSKLKRETFNEDRWNLHMPANFEIIQVKPNWHNSMDVVGYLSNIPEPHYVFTPFIHFIVEAYRHPNIPYFLCLDEMNLAPVEEYFAEFLSAIESRSKENGKYITDPIIKPFGEFGTLKTTDKNGNTKVINVTEQMLDTLINADEKDKAANVIREHLTNKGLTLPANLIVIGTVNMDETTFSFSRKVLDRAMSFEMNVVEYDKFLAGETDNDLKVIADKNKDVVLNDYLTQRVVDAKEKFSKDDKDASDVIDYLNTVNGLLDGTQFKLGYRAANEALIYLSACKDMHCGNVSRVLDDFTLMKILSRFEGDESKLRLTKNQTDFLAEKKIPAGEEKTLLSAMINLINKKLNGYQKDDNQNEETDNDSGSTEKWESVKKAELMQEILTRDRFVSFWN